MGEVRRLGGWEGNGGRGGGEVRRDLTEVVHVQCARHALSPIPLSP